MMIDRVNDKYEAIAWLENIKEKYIHGGDEKFDECRRESINMAIKALRQPQIVRCEDCKHSNFYCTEDADGEWLFECCHPSTGDNSVIHKWNWFCADGERG